MKEPLLSISVYGTATLVVAGLVYAGFVYKADADVKTMVNSAEVKLRLAASMSQRDKKGTAVAVRADLLRQAREHLDQVDRIEPGHAPAAELRGYVCFLEGRYEDAAKAYLQARACHDCTDEMAETFRINEARMWRASGRPKEAVAALSDGGLFTEQRRGQAELERLLALVECGAKKEALALAGELALRPGQNSAAQVEIGRCLERLEDLDAAERVYQQARKENTEGTYALARLKLVRGAADTALDLLEECFKSDGGKAKGWVESDRAFWQSIATGDRFRRLMETAGLATPSGR